MQSSQMLEVFPVSTVGEFYSLNAASFQSGAQRRVRPYLLVEKLGPLRFSSAISTRKHFPISTHSSRPAAANPAILGSLSAPNGALRCEGSNGQALERGVPESIGNGTKEHAD